MVQFAFKETDAATEEISRLFDFIWPTAIALWNLRWQVEGFLKAVPDASYEQVHARFVAGSGLHGSDVCAMLKNLTWDEQKERFAEVILTNAFAIYESWAKQMLTRTGASAFKDRDLYTIGNRTRLGLSAFISSVNANQSSVMTRGFKPVFLKHRKAMPTLIDNMLLCYRYFKEVRNCQMHNGGIADAKAVTAYNDYQPVASASAMRTKEAIDHFPIVAGTPAKLSIRGVVGFCDILLRLMITVDAELSGSTAAETAALEKLRARGKQVLTLGSKKASITRKIRSICFAVGLPNPADEAIVLKYFLDNRVVSR